MKITKRHLRRIIKEEKRKLVREQEDRLFKMTVVREFDKVIAYNKKMAASVMAPEEIEMYEDDASQLEYIRDMAIEQKASGASEGNEQLRDYMHRIDTAVREQIPTDVYRWIVGEVW